MKISSKDFRVPEGDKVNLKKWSTAVKPVYKSKEQYQKLLEQHIAQLSSLHGAPDPKRNLISFYEKRTAVQVQNIPVKVQLTLPGMRRKVGIANGHGSTVCAMLTGHLIGAAYVRK